MPWACSHLHVQSRPPRRSYNDPVGLSFSRLRGKVLRVAQRRVVAVASGSALIAGAFFVGRLSLLGDGTVEQGLVLVLGATGVALVLAGFGGRRPDWIDSD